MAGSIRAGLLGCMLAAVLALDAGLATERVPKSPADAALGEAALGGVFHLSIGTGGPTGIYFVAGNAICRLINRRPGPRAPGASSHALTCSAPTTPGSIANIAELRSNSLTFGIVQSDWQHHAYVGSNRFEGRPFQLLRSVLSLHPEAFQILAAPGSGIENFAGLAGKRVSLGEKGSGTRSTFDVLMQAQGVDTSYFARTEELTLSSQANALCNGDVDAVAYATGIPSGLVATATIDCRAQLIDLASPAVTELLKHNKFYALTKIPGGTYPAMSSDVSTFAVVATLVTRADTPEDVVYEVTRAIFEGLDDLRRMHPAFADLRHERMISAGLTAPLHPGARRYYIEKGWIAPGHR